MRDANNFKYGYSVVNGLKMYYEIYGSGKPLVLIHGGGSTIATSFGRIIPQLAKHRQILAVELQAHGHTNDRNTVLTFEQDADDVATLLNNLNIPKADFLGFSNGAHAVVEIALRHSGLINKIILASGVYQRSATAPQFFEIFDVASLTTDFPEVLKEGYLKANNDLAALQNMFDKDVQRMKVFKGWTNDQLKEIKAPTLLISGNKDIINPEKVVEIYRLIPDSELAILPGGHGDYLGSIETLRSDKWEQTYASGLIELFLDKE
jgi:pimeloyl-ACP methyl ester carboxylesterase